LRIFIARAVLQMDAACDALRSWGMDGDFQNLYFSAMRPGQPSSRGEASSLPASVPAFYLYGELLQPPDERLIHVETIAARSHLHDWIIRPHRHRDLHQLLLIERGRVEARLDERSAPLRAPAAILVPPGAVHSFRFQPGTAGVVVSFAATLAGELRAVSPGLSEHLERCAAILLDRAALRDTDLRALAQMLLREFGRLAPGRRLALRGTLAALLANLQRLLPDVPDTVAMVSSRDRELVARFREQVEQRFRRHPALTEYAALLQTPETRLRRACLAVAGQSPVDLIHLRLLLEAERQLRYTSMPVTQVAYYLGFEDPAYFSRFFARRMGMSPRAYRERDARTILERPQQP
jgi:AraC family transcriptional activator of pobA